jgi:hypothetical protein
MDECMTASDRRLARARNIVDVFAARDDVAAVLVVGSVARGWADRWSDLELLVCWTALPSERQLGTLADRAGAGTRRVFPGEPMDEEWQAGGLKIDVLHRTVAGVDRVIAGVVERHETSWPKQAQVAAIRDGIAMHGEGLIENWRERSAYTDDLARAMVGAHLTFGPHAWLEMLVERGDALYLYTLCCEVERRIIGVLLGLNRVYPPAGDTKWAMLVARELPIAPLSLPDRLVGVFRSEPREGVRELTRLIDETITLVERHMPEVATRPVRARIAERRPVWDGTIP